MFKTCEWGQEVPMGFAKTLKERGEMVDGKFRYITFPSYLFSLRLWSAVGRRYNVRTDEMTDGVWRLVVRFRYTKGSGFSFRKGWSLEQGKPVEPVATVPVPLDVVWVSYNGNFAVRRSKTDSSGEPNG